MEIGKQKELNRKVAEYKLRKNEDDLYEIMKECSNTFYYHINKFNPKYTHFDDVDYHNSCQMKMEEWIDVYDDSKSSFGTYIYSCSFHFLQKEFRKERTQKRDFGKNYFDFSEVEYFISDPNNDLNKKEIEDRNEVIFQFFIEKHGENLGGMINQRLKGASYKEIASNGEFTPIQIRNKLVYTFSKLKNENIDLETILQSQRVEVSKLNSKKNEKTRD